MCVIRRGLALPGSIKVGRSWAGAIRVHDPDRDYGRVLLGGAAFVLSVELDVTLPSVAGEPALTQADVVGGAVKR
jgi:hypothetical protein